MATAFAPPQPMATAFAPPQPAPTAFAPPQPAPTAYAPPQSPAYTPHPAPSSGSAPDTFKSGGAVMTGPTGAPPGMARNKGATSFTTTCPNPNCRKPVLVPPTGTAQCAFCGTMVDAMGQAVQGLPAGQQQFGLTGAANEATAAAAAAAVAAVARPQPPTGTVALQPLSAQVRAIVLEGAAGTFRVLPGIEVRVGRDGTLCSISFAEPRVSGVHASLRLEGGLLEVRDDKSHNGTYVNGNRIPAGTWTPVPGGSQLRFGPVELMVRHEP